MIDFIMWLIFGASVPLTEHTIDVTQDCVTLAPKSTMVVRGGGAGIIVESAYAPEDHWPAGIIDRLNKLKRDFPPSRLTATAYRADGTSVAMVNHNEQGAGNGVYELALTPDTELQHKDAFTRVKICASPPMKGVKIYWRRIAQ